MRVGARRRDSLALRLALGAGAVLALLALATAFFLSWAFRQTETDFFRQRLDSHLDALVVAADLSDAGPDSPLAQPAPGALGDLRFDQPKSGWYWRISDGGRTILRSPSLWDEDLPDAEWEGQGTRSWGFVQGPGGKRLLAVGQDVVASEGGPSMRLLVAADAKEIERASEAFDRMLWLATVALSLALALGSAVQIRLGLAPLRRLRGELAALRSGRVARLPSGGHPAEVAPLIEEMNAVLDADADLVERARSHVGNVAHAMKTPLAVISAELSRGASADFQQLRARTEELRRLVERHLAKAHAEAAADRPVRGGCPAAPPTIDVLSALRRISGERIVLEEELDMEAFFQGDEGDLQEIVGNLAENACKWASSRVRVRLFEAEGGLRLVVEDDGPGMEEEFAAKATERGARLDERVPGSGLGLSIVLDLVEVLGGSLAFGRSEWGGLRAEVSIPRR